jgi:hypothetical protein
MKKRNDITVLTYSFSLQNATSNSMAIGFEIKCAKSGEHLTSVIVYVDVTSEQIIKSLPNDVTGGFLGFKFVPHGHTQHAVAIINHVTKRCMVLEQSLVTRYIVNLMNETRFREPNKLIEVVTSRIQKCDGDYKKLLDSFTKGQSFYVFKAKNGVANPAGKYKCVVKVNTNAVIKEGDFSVRAAHANQMKLILNKLNNTS